MNDIKKDDLCRYYVDGMAFFANNMDVIEEHVQREKAHGKDTAAEEEAIRRLMCAKEGVQRMLSDRAAVLGMGKMDMAEVIGDLVALKNGLDDAGQQAVDYAVNMLVRQREKLTNTDRGRRALQKKIVRYKNRYEKLTKDYKQLQEVLGRALDAYKSAYGEVNRLRRELGKIHCEKYECNGCPYEEHCTDDNVFMVSMEERQRQMRKELLGAETESQK